MNTSLLAAKPLCYLTSIGRPLLCRLAEETWSWIGCGLGHLPKNDSRQPPWDTPPYDEKIPGQVGEGQDFQGPLTASGCH